MSIRDLRKKYRTSWFKPPLYDVEYRWKYALEWTRQVAAALADAASAYQRALELGDTKAQVRARSVVAADRAYLSYWVSSFRRQARVQPIPLEEVQRVLGPVLTALEAAWGAIGPQVDVHHVQEAQGVLRRRSRRAKVNITPGHNPI